MMLDVLEKSMAITGAADDDDNSAAADDDDGAADGAAAAAASATAASAAASAVFPSKALFPSKFCLAWPQGIGDKLRIVALAHWQQHRSASYHGGGGVAADRAHVMAAPHSLSWSAGGGGGAIHEC